MVKTKAPLRSDKDVAIIIKPALRVCQEFKGVFKTLPTVELAFWGLDFYRDFLYNKEET